MKRYVISNSAGEIIRTATCTAESAAAQVQPGETVNEDADAHAGTHWVNATGKLKTYTEAQSKRKRLLRAEGLWDNAAMDWTDLRSFADRKIAKWGEMKDKRNAKATSTFIWDGSEFDCDEHSVALLQMTLSGAQLALQTQAPFSVTWTLADNSTRDLGAADMLGVMQALGAHVGAMYAKGRERRAAVQAAAAPIDLEAITWS